MNYLNYKEKIIPKLKSLLNTEIKDYFQVVSLKKNEFLIEEGDVCIYYYFVSDGILRNFYLKNGMEITTNFDMPDDIATNYTSLVLNQRGITYIQAITKSTVYKMKAIDFEGLKKNNQFMQEIKEALVSSYIILLEERLHSLQFCTASERYNFLVQKYPHFIQKIPLTFIASYLGISLETLSRIRAKY